MKRFRYRAQLSGPITGMPDLNRKAFIDATEKVEALGYQVWNPNDWSDLSPAIDPETRPQKFWMQRSIRQLFEADLLVMLPGWMPSDGAMAERVVARQFGMPVVYLSDRPGAYRCEWRRSN